MSEPLSLAEIRRRLGLDYDLDAYVLEKMREAYAASRHEPLMLNDLGGERPFTVELAMGYANRLMADD